jgi:hypothetical protein
MAIKDMTDQQIVEALQTTPSGATRNGLEIEWAKRIMEQKKAQFLPIVQQELGWADFTVEMGNGTVTLREVRDEL